MVTEAKREVIARMIMVIRNTITINEIINGYRQNYKINNPPKEPSLSNLSSFVTQDGVRFEAKNQQVFQDACTEE